MLKHEEWLYRVHMLSIPWWGQGSGVLSLNTSIGELLEIFLLVSYWSPLSCWNALKAKSSLRSLQDYVLVRTLDRAREGILSLSCCGNFLAIGSLDCRVRIYDTSQDMMDTVGSNTFRIDMPFIP